MFGEIEARIVNSLQMVFDQFGWLGVSSMLVFENATGLTPSEIILGLAGWMLISAHELPFATVFLGGLYAAAGSSLGASLAYWVSRLGGRPLVERIARYVRIEQEEILKAERLFQRWGQGLVFFGRVIPVVRTIISIPAGLAKMPYLRFLAWTFAGAYLWCSLLLAAGFWMGNEYHLLSGMVHQYFPFALAAGLLGLAAIIVWRNRQKIFQPKKA
jgi:membrane protein DedA with SNARE-associated domain